MANNLLSFTQNAGVAVTQGSHSGTLKSCASGQQRHHRDQWQLLAIS